MQGTVEVKWLCVDENGRLSDSRMTDSWTTCLGVPVVFFFHTWSDVGEHVYDASRVHYQALFARAALRLVGSVGRSLPRMLKVFAPTRQRRIVKLTRSTEIVSRGKREDESVWKLRRCGR